MHRGWGNRPGSDSLAKHDGFRRGPGGHEGFRGPDDWASRGGHQHHGERIHYTPEQHQQLMTINKDFKQKSEALFAQDNITLKQYKAGLIALQKDKKAKLEALLTPQQKNEMAERRKRMTENTQVMAVARLERLRLHLNLSDDQVAKLKAGQENLRSQVKAIHENDNLLPQEKRQQMKALLAKRNDTYKAVLTPDQYSQFEKMHHHPGNGPGGGRRFGGSPNGPGDPGSAI
jgi:hypothetical protein